MTKSDFNKRSKILTKKMARDFKKSLKHSIFDEIFTLYVFRPIAFIFLKMFYKIPITPNQISLLSILVGIVAGVFFSFGTYFWFVIGGVCFGIATVLDCLDGMIARLKNMGTYIGRIIDGISDYIASVAIHIGFALGIVNNPQLNFPINPWILMALAAVFNIMHSIMVDYYKSEFMYYALGKGFSREEEKQRFREELKKMKNQKLKLLDKIIVYTYLGYTHLQTSSSVITKNKYDRETYYKKNRVLIQFWFLIGPNMHIVLMMIAAFLYRPMIYFYYVIGFGNLLMVVLWIIQVRLNKKLLLNKE